MCLHGIRTKVPKVDPTFITHRLNVLVTRPKRSTKPHMEVMREEVKKLKQAGAIKEVFFP